MRRYLLPLAAFAILFSIPGNAASQYQFDGLIDSVEEAYSAANFIVAFSTPAERSVLSHYSTSGSLPSSYRTARLVRVHDCLVALAATDSPVERYLESANAVYPVPVRELVRIRSIEQTDDYVDVLLTVHLLDMRTNLEMIRAYDDPTLDISSEALTASWETGMESNPWRRENHRWRQTEGSWRVVSDDLALLQSN